MQKRAEDKQRRPGEDQPQRRIRGHPPGLEGANSRKELDKERIEAQIDPQNILAQGQEAECGGANTARNNQPWRSKNQGQESHTAAYKPERGIVLQ